MIHGSLIYTAASLALAGAALPDTAHQTRSCDVALPTAPSNWSFGTGFGAPFQEHFEDYPIGEICGFGRWEPFFGDPRVCGVVTDERANHGDRSLKIVGNVGPVGDDTVRLMDVVGGIWTFKVMTFVPQDSTGSFYILLLNQYPVLLNWSVQVEFDSDTDIVHVDFSGEETPLIRECWVEFRLEIDLIDDRVSYYYDGVPFVFDKSWRDGVSGGGLPHIAVVDFYANEPPNGTSGVYFDDVTLIDQWSDEPCDTNCDRRVDAFDVEPFIEALLGGFRCSTVAGDVDGNGFVDAFDIEPFVNCLVGP